MAYESYHTGAEIDAAVQMLGEIQEIRDESNQNLQQVQQAAAAAGNSAQAAAEAAGRSEAALEDATSAIAESQQQWSASVAAEQLAMARARQAAEAAAAESAGNASDAAQAAATAVEVVTGGTASLTAQPGKIPIADATGKIDLQWLGPDVAARIAMLSVPVNHIGIPGGVGFGVGICPEIPAGYSALGGTFMLASDEYGNYRYSDGSAMVWIPAFYYRIGHADNPTFTRYGVNSIDVQPFSAFPDRASAALAGYALHRAFIDGGEVVPGFMRDKYQCSNNSGIASSIKNGAPLSSAVAHNPFNALNGAPANNNSGAIAAAKTRGGQFFPASRFMRAALAILAEAHGQAATTAANCAWYDPAGATNFPKGNNSNTFSDVNDRDITFTSDGFEGGNSALTGSGVPFAKTTHNGQNSGIADINGNMYAVELGMTCVATSKPITAATQANPVALTVAGHGLQTGDVVMILSAVGMTQINGRLFTVTVVNADTVTLDGVDGAGFDAYDGGGTLTAGQFYIARETTRMEEFTAGNGLATDHWGANGVAAMMEPITPAFRTDYPNNGHAQRYGNAENQVLSPATDGNGWQLTGLGFPQPDGASTAGTSQFGQDYYYQYIRNELCLLSGLHWSTGVYAGAWGVNVGNARTSSNTPYGFCAASYPVRPRDSEE